MNQLTRTAILLLALSAAGGCGRSGPRAIVEGQDSCEYCRMSISDVRFGAQLITGTGKVHTFDSIECLAGFFASLPAGTDVTGLYVTDFRNAGAFVAAKDAIYLVDGRIESPMGRRVVAFTAAESAVDLTASYGGSVKSWDEVRALLETEGEAHSATHAHDRATSEAGRAR